ncbi:tellurite-resistance/dicarboxylate transporter [Thermococcus sp. JdF3]|uniref:tellurite-resistance/dicarboxylate transporter n=1 Tax=Thermococcus sp. JdF3 TaxID=1638258 RepID=UPI00143A3D32|nr:tellurite-resistance/dicarboxylate transporter [Thermococcus sp. JdF3]NJE01674.1 C4-dicarboxylate ABC transporter [Thermococcus sp. JdF3]
MGIKDFAPSWFASVMGTGALALVSNAYSEKLPLLGSFAEFLIYLNTVLFFALLAPWILRWLKYREDALRDLHHPVLGNFYGTIAIAMLILSADYLMIFENTTIAWAFWLAGVPLTVFFAFLIPYLFFTCEGIDTKAITPAWFIPPVGLIVIPISGAKLMTLASGTAREIMAFINFFAWGSGFFLYLALFALVMLRFIRHEPMPCGIAPSIWINLGPIGAGTSTLYALVKASDFITVKEPFLAFGLLFWGFGVWWFVMAVILTLHYIRKLNLPYSLAWWAFIFPLGAYVSATFNVGTTFGINAIVNFGFALYWLLLAMWLVTGALTLKNFLLKGPAQRGAS